MKLFRGTLRIRTVLLTLLAIGGFWWIVELLYTYFADVCHGHLHMRYLCQQYKRGVISGSLCPKLCDRMEITLSNCIKKDSSSSTFLWRQLELRANNEHLRQAQSGRSAGLGFLEPQQGRSMEEFRGMVLTFMESKLGTGDHNALVDRALDLADINKDTKVSLAEAKSLWALLHINEFFIHFVFADCEHVPSLQGFCGDTFAYDYANHRKLYTKDRTGLLYWLFPNHHRWLFPQWHERAKIVVGLLEFTMEAYQHGSEGTFHLCNIDELQVGYTDKFDVKILNTAEVISNKELVSKLEGQQCTRQEDCRYSDMCGTDCISSTGKCNSMVLRPSLHYVCRIVEEYVLQDAPSELVQDMDRLLGRCAQLGKDSDKAQVEQSLILNDLKLLLWKQISYASS